ncbi:MAG TPA: MoxR family ATPase [Methylomirabilota bacterium]|nr:MoxR family ATPase [Methylomirabilota bacterium]
MPRSSCIACKELIDFPDELSGKEVDCPVCGKPTLLPQSRATPTIKIPVFNPGRSWARESTPTLVTEVASKLIDNVERVVVGKRQQVQLATVCLFSEGHLLLEDVPGVAKTMLARAMAQSIDCTFKRIQCTPDLLPNDVTGASIFNPKTTDFEFRAGPVFAHLVLADEINRATPRTQSALLEAMSEKHVTVDGTLHPLPSPFFLIATQNPIDHEGTFPLPEAQLDRFLMRISLGYPEFAQELRMLQNIQAAHPIDNLRPVVSATETLEAIAGVRSIRVDPRVQEYLLRIIQATREHESIRLGASPRAALALFRAAQAYAGIQGYTFVLPDDVKELAPHILNHRLLLKPEARIRKVALHTVINEILEQTPVPTLDR